MAELWRDIPGWPGYQASYGGEIRSLFGGLPYVLKPSKDRKGYLTVTVRKDGKSSTKRVHVLVALAWVKPQRRRTQVRHLDGDKLNCAAWNLKYGNQPEQEWDKRQAGTSRVKRGMERDGSEKREKEGIRTEAYRARDSRTSGT